MPEKNQPFKIGDSVKVKPNTLDPDYDEDISDWVGRIAEIEDDTILIEWDSLTLTNMTAETIRQCDEDDLDWSVMSLYPPDIELTDARDTPAEVESVLKKLINTYRWDYLGEEGPRVKDVLQDVDSDDEWAAFEAWEKHFRKVLKFPFEAEVMEQQKGPVRQGDVVKVLEITEIMEPYGVLVQCSHKRGGYVLPLCDLEVTKESSSNYQPVKDYAVWFANR
jgi:Calcium binding